MNVLLGALLMAALAPAPAPLPLDLGRFMDRAEELDGRRVEFHAYVALMRRPGDPPTLNAVTGETRYVVNGRAVTIWCADNPEANVAVLLQRNGLGPLSRRAARPFGAYVGVTIRGILRARPYSFRVGNARHEWVGSIDHARIVRVTGGRCLTDPPRRR